MLSFTISVNSSFIWSITLEPLGRPTGGHAYMYKAVLQNDLLQDPEGVNYFKNTLKKYFLKGATNVSLYRLLSFFLHRRQNQEFLIFTSKFEILS